MGNDKSSESKCSKKKKNYESRKDVIQELYITLEIGLIGRLNSYMEKDDGDFAFTYTILAIHIYMM